MRILKSSAKNFLFPWFALACLLCRAQEPLPGLKPYHRVVFIGDSITYAGGFIDDIEAYVRTHDTNSTITFLNLGQSSEMVAGYSENGRPGGVYVPPGRAGQKDDRPDLHARLPDILQKTKPDLVVADYGMNDGVYQPFSDAHFKAFKDGIRWMHDTVVQYGARIVHVTPPPFDPVGSKKHLTARGLRGFYAPYTNYDDVLARYSAWLVSQRARGWDVVDIHTPMDQFLAQRRKTNPRFTFTRDGVHPDVQGHWLMAREILMHWDAPDSLAKMDSVNAMVADDPRGAELLKAVVEKQDILRGAWLTYVGHMNFRFKPGLPLAQAEQRAAALDKKIRALEARQL